MYCAPIPTVLKTNNKHIDELKQVCLKFETCPKIERNTTHGLPPVSRPVTYKGTPSLLPCPQRCTRPMVHF